MSTYCNSCNHDHQGDRLGYICIGCPCNERPGAGDDDGYTLAMRIADIADENCGMQPVSTPDDLLSVIERSLREQHGEIERLRASAARWAPVINASCDWRRVQSVEHDDGTVERRLVDAIDAALAAKETK